MTNIFPVDGDAGIGTDDPTYGLLQIQLTTEQARGQRTGIAMTVAGDANNLMLYPRPSPGGDTYDWLFTRSQQDGRGLLLDPGGNVTFSQNVLVEGELTVTGAVTLNRDVTVTAPLKAFRSVDFAADLSIGGALKIKNWEIAVPDYVFEPDYHPLGLRELAAFVRDHKHLPEIPSAQQLQMEGLDAATMILLLLKKVEELTLYILQHQQSLQGLERRLAACEIR